MASATLFSYFCLVGKEVGRALQKGQAELRRGKLECRRCSYLCKRT